jgi:hypothetical protein
LSPNKHTRVHGEISEIRRIPTIGRLVAASCVVALQGCGGADPAAPGAVGGKDAAPEAAADVAPAVPRCLPPDGIPAAPVSIAEVVDLVNRLPPPVTLACFLESLARPLRLQAADSLISLQPSRTRSPRMFLFSGPLIMTIVPEGKGAHLVELGQLTGPERSLKAEVAFPVTERVNPGDPYTRVLSGTGTGAGAGTGTTCRFCHRDEIQAEEITHAAAFASGALKPRQRDRVPLGDVLLERQRCGEAADAQDDRCAMFRALFDHGEVLPAEFPATIPTISD